MLLSKVKRILMESEVLTQLYCEWQFNLKLPKMVISRKSLSYPLKDQETDNLFLKTFLQLILEQVYRYAHLDFSDNAFILWERTP